MMDRLDSYCSLLHCRTLVLYEYKGLCLVFSLYTMQLFCGKREFGRIVVSFVCSVEYN